MNENISKYSVKIRFQNLRTQLFNQAQHGKRYQFHHITMKFPNIKNNGKALKVLERKYNLQGNKNQTSHLKHVVQ